MSEDCPHCIHNDECHDKCRGCFEGSNYKPKPLTNADRIRSMTDEELAEWIFNTLWSYDAICEKRKKDWLDWLNQEAVDNGACSANETSEKVQDE